MPTLSEGLEAFTRYNLAAWPAHVAAYLLALAVLLLVVVRSGAFTSRLALLVLAAFWIWTGLVSNGVVNPPAVAVREGRLTLNQLSGLGAAALVQGLLFLRRALFRPEFGFRFQRGPYGTIAVLLAVYAVVGYPLAGLLLGRELTQLMPVGLVPCPTAVFTLGLLLLADARVPWVLLVVPVIVAAAGFLVVTVGLYEDVALVLATAVAVPLIVARRWPAGEVQAGTRRVLAGRG